MALETWRPRLMAWNPFRDLARVERDMEDMFGRPLRWPFGDGVRTKRCGNYAAAAT